LGGGTQAGEALVPRPQFAAPSVLLSVALLAVLALAVPAEARAATAHRGFHLHSLWWENSNADMDRELELVKASGANTIRVDVAWSSLEQGAKGSRTSWYLDKLDRLVGGARARGLEIIATVHSTPCWASSAPASVKQDCAGEWWSRGVTQYPPANAGDYADIVGWIAARYGPSIRAIEIWNEPNLERFFKAPDQAAAYATLIKAAHPAVKAASPGTTVLGASLAFADRAFLERLYQHGIKGSYDGLAFHPYNEWRDPSDRWQAQWSKYAFLPGIESMKAAQVAAGDGAPIWITEFGWSTCTGNGWCVDEATQAAYLAEGLEILAGMPYVEAAIVYNLRDNGTSASDLESNWGIVHRDFAPKPALAAVTRALTSPGSTPAAGEPSPTPVQPTEPKRPAPSGGRKKTPRRLTLRVSVSARGTAYARGAAPRGARVRVRLASCKRARAHTRRVRAKASGHYRARLGRVRGIRGCRVVARAGRWHRAVAVRSGARRRAAARRAR
jgi:polysaccharide biosynthesis protein PslG